MTAKKRGGKRGGSSDEGAEKEEEKGVSTERYDDLYSRAMLRKKKREEDVKRKEEKEMSHSFHPRTNINKKELSPNSIKYSVQMYERGMEDLKRKDERTIARYHEFQMNEQGGVRFVEGAMLSVQMGVPPSLRKKKRSEGGGETSPTTSRAYLPGGRVWSKPDVVGSDSMEAAADREFTKEQEKSFQAFLIASQKTMQEEEKKDVVIDDIENDRKTRGKELDMRLSQREANLEAMAGWDHGVVR